MREPQYQHDCDSCTFLGRLADHDIYTCDQGGVMPTVIARFGNDGPAYTSGPEIWVRNMHVDLRVTPERLRSTHLQMDAWADAISMDAHRTMLDTEYTRFQLAQRLYVKVLDMYARHDIDDKPTLEDARHTLNRFVVTR